MPRRKSFVTKWPRGFNPDNPDVVTVSAIIDEGVSGSDEGPKPLHKHPTGQLMVATEGIVGIEFEDSYWAIPARCGVWVPPDIPHQGVLGLGGKSVSMHVGPAWVGSLPTQSTLMMMKPLTIEMIIASATPAWKKRSTEYRNHFSQVLIDDVANAKQLPSNFAPLPKSPFLLKILREMHDADKAGWTMAEWAAHVGMSERTLGRNALRETGMTFYNWRLQHLFLRSIEHLAEKMSVDEVASLAGYRNTSAYIKVFKEVFGMTPGTYARQVLRGDPED